MTMMRMEEMRKIRMRMMTEEMRRGVPHEMNSKG
jgi:hypothetical protein